MDWKDVVRAAAPVIGTALGGPAGGAALSFLGDKLLGKPNATEAEIAAHVRDMAPEQQVRLTQLQNEFKVAMGQQGIDLEKLRIQQQQIEAQDRDSARTLQTKTRSWAPAVLSAVAVLGFLGSLAAVYFLPLPQDRKDVVIFLLGVLTVLVKDVYAFYFGATAESANKDATIKHMWDSTP